MCDFINGIGPAGQASVHVYTCKRREYTVSYLSIVPETAVEQGRDLLQYKLSHFIPILLVVRGHELTQLFQSLYYSRILSSVYRHIIDYGLLLQCWS